MMKLSDAAVVLIHELNKILFGSGSKKTAVDTDTGITAGVAKVRSTVFTPPLHDAGIVDGTDALSAPPVVENVTEQRPEFVAKGPDANGL